MGHHMNSWVDFNSWVNLFFHCKKKHLRLLIASYIWKVLYSNVFGGGRIYLKVLHLWSQTIVDQKYLGIMLFLY